MSPRTVRTTLTCGSLEHFNHGMTRALADQTAHHAGAELRVPLERLARAAIRDDDDAEAAIRRVPRCLPDGNVGEHPGDEQRVAAGRIQRLGERRLDEGAVGRARKDRLVVIGAASSRISSRGSPTGSGSSLTCIWRDMSFDRHSERRGRYAGRNSRCARQAATSRAMFFSAASACRKYSSNSRSMPRSLASRPSPGSGSS